MVRFVLLDAAPLGLASRRRGLPPVDRCRAWLHALNATGATIIVPEIADYEVRRELQRMGSQASLMRLDDLATEFRYAEITTTIMRQAAELWADVRRRGLPTAGNRALDADAILAAQATLIGGPGDTVTVATSNVAHLARFPGVDARDWSTIA
ncbi:MAG TPA: PIN domain-containing protein [Isosphaeraceae bacterium]